MKNIIIIFLVLLSGCARSQVQSDSAFLKKTNAKAQRIDKMTEYQLRLGRLQEASAYLLSIGITQAQLETYISDAPLTNYLVGSNNIINWIAGTGSFTNTGFPSKAYYNNLPTAGANRGNEIKTQLLSILNP